MTESPSPPGTGAPKKPWLAWAAGAAALLLLTGWWIAATGQGPAAGVSGRVLLWHAWSETDTAVLNQALAQYEQIHPGAHIVAVRLSPDEIGSRFAEAASLGLGPDLIISSSRAAAGWAAGDLIQPIPADILTLQFYRPAVDSITLDGEIYGLPLSMQTQVLYFNRSLVDGGTANLEALENQVAGELSAGLPIGFEGGFWGIGAFGGRFMAEEGRINPEQLAFSAWLLWLQKNQINPGFALSRDQSALQELFIEGLLGYLVDGPELFPRLLATWPREQIGVALLPGGPGGAASPLLTTEAIFFNRSSSSRQFELALDVARFLTNVEQNASTMRKTSRIPANRRVLINQRLFPEISTFILQSRTAVVLPPDLMTPAVLTAGGNIYTSVLSGISDPAEALCAFRRQVRPDEVSAAGQNGDCPPANQTP